MRYEGDFNSSTEYSTFVPHPGFHRSELRRRGTSLRMEGDFEGKTEKNDKFTTWPSDWFEACRQNPVKIPSNLKLEGQIETRTENHDQYVPFVGARRPEILKQAAQLRLEGDNSWTPEYNAVFKDHFFTGKIFFSFACIDIYLIFDVS